MKLPNPLLLILALLLACSSQAFAQEPASSDKITLNNGDTLQGTVKSMADGLIVFNSTTLGDVKIKIGDVRDLSTTKPLVLVTKHGERLERRITGIQNGNLQLADGQVGDPAIGALPVDVLDKINPPPTAWTGSITFGASLITGNVERRAAAGDATAIRRSDADRITMLGYWEYGEDKDQTTLDWRLTQRRTGAQIKYDYFLSKKDYIWVGVGAENNALADLALRFTFGAGYGRQWVETDRTKFSTEIGAVYFYEDYQGTTPTKEYIAARIGYRLEHRLSATLMFLQTLDAFPSLENIADFYGRVDSRLIANLTASMIAQLKIVLDYNNTPAVGRDRMDVGYFLTVGWTF